MPDQRTTPPPAGSRARDIRTDTEGIIVGVDQPGSRGHYWLQLPEGGKEWPVPKQYVQILREHNVQTPPSHWLRQRAGDPDVVRLNADEAEMIARRAGAVGDHLKPAGLVWREPDRDARDGYAYYTITPVWESPAGQSAAD